MMMEERLIQILDDLKKDIEELSSRKTAIVSTINMTVETTIDDIRAIPSYIQSLERSLQEIQQVNKDIDEKIMQAEQTIDTLTRETEISQMNKADLEKTEEGKRSQKSSLETNIAEYQTKKAELDTKFVELDNMVKMKEEEFNQLQITSKEEIEALNQKINEASTRLEQAKNENKLIVYLMDSGLLDVPEAEVVSIIASYPNGLTLAEIKEKVSMAPVRVQPTINNLLENVLEHDLHSDTYKILDSLKDQLG
jgi:chromosome segregation ATPase